MYIKALQKFGDNAVLKLRKALYDLKQAPQAWHDSFNNFLKRIGFLPNPYDPCFYIKHFWKMRSSLS